MDDAKKSRRAAARAALKDGPRNLTTEDVTYIIDVFDVYVKPERDLNNFTQ